MSQISADHPLVVWFDIDNTLYSATAGIAEAMGELIKAYFLSLGLDRDEASNLHLKYYTTYGLALRGLIRHHSVDPLDFDAKCDGSLPLEDMLRPDPALRKLFQDIDRSKCQVWALTNAYRPHAQRVLRILDLEDQIDGLVYCDYTLPNFVCKPDPEFYHNALRQAKITDPSKCLFVDDNRGNIDAAKRLGWGQCVHFHEKELRSVEGGQVEAIGSERAEGAVGNDVLVISNLEELRVVWPDIFSNNFAA